MFRFFESSRTKGEPIELYLWTYGDTPGAYYAYTNAQGVVTLDGISYRPIPIKRSNIVASGTLDKAALTVNTPSNVETADLFRIYPPSQVVTLTILQGHADDTDIDFKPLWNGRVLSAAYDGNDCAYTCEPISTSLKRPGLRRNWQYGCPHFLYGPQCRADKAAATATRAITGMSGTSITMPDGWASGGLAPKYVGGLATWKQASDITEIRTILRVDDGRTLLLSGRLTGLAIGMNVAVSLGCNHQPGLTDDCIVLHDNILNYGGQAWIPSQNPIGQFNNFF